MSEHGLEWILRDLGGERIRRGEGAARKGVVEDAMEIDDRPALAHGPVPAAVKVTLPPGTTATPRAVIDLESLTFAQGGHLMSNKKCKLPEGSFKRSKKGYEEVHVSAPKPKPFANNEKLIPINELPMWIHEAFKGARTLNRIQSQIYPVAFEQDYWCYRKKVIKRFQ